MNHILVIVSEMKGRARVSLRLIARISKWARQKELSKEHAHSSACMCVLERETDKQTERIKYYKM